MATDAEVSPLPSELTTPPVTKMCFVMSGLILGKRCGRVRRGDGSPSVTISHRVARSNDRSRSGRVKTRSRRPARAVVPAPADKGVIIGRRVDPAVCLGNQPDADGAAGAEDA